MNSARQSVVLKALKRPFASTLYHFGILLWSGLFAASVARGEPFKKSAEASVLSVSGQFVTTAASGYSPLLHHPVVAANPDFVRLEPTFLAVSAERIRLALSQKLKFKSSEQWSGKIFLALHPAASLAEEPVLVAQPFLDKWNCRVEIPDVTSGTRLIRAITAALLLEYANRHISDLTKPAEVPSWLADGLAQEIMADAGDRVILGAPSKEIQGIPQNRIERTERGRNPLHAAHTVLQQNDALTFEDLSWPTADQLTGADGGAYRASAQLLVHSLLALRDGPEKLRRMLEESAHCENWQTAFYRAFSASFPRPLDMEKWWTLRVVSFATRNPGPRWSPSVSQQRLAEALAVSADFRGTSNALPWHMEVSLQTAIRNFDAKQQSTVLPVKLRDLELAELRLAPDFAALARGYRSALAGYLGAGPAPHPGILVKTPAASSRNDKEQVIKQLDALDARRRELEVRLREDTFREKLLRQKTGGASLDRK